MLNFGNSITTSVTIYIYVENGACTDQSSFNVTINSTEDFSITEDNLEIDVQDLTVNMTDTSIDYEYSIDGLNPQSSNEFSNLTEGIHTLYVSDANGCLERSIQFEIIIVRFIVPKYFTPNEDTYNDTWQVIDTENSIKSIHIFDRHGKLLKQISPSSQGWDGTFNGRNMPVNDYWYLIVLESGKSINGHFSLKR